MDDQLISIAALLDLVRSVFEAAGLAPGPAEAVARVVVAGERDGCASHGLYRVDGCLGTLRAGLVEAAAVPAARPSAGGVVRVDAARGFTPPAFELGAPLLARRAREVGLAALAINDGTHFSALWPEVEDLAGRGLAALALCPSYSAVAPAGGRGPLLGTNPMAFAWPRPGRPPYVFDFATSVAARGEVELRRRAGEALPEGWALGPDGRPTTRPEEALAGALLPFGGHKGSALSTMIELLGGAMIGDLTSPEAFAAMGGVPLLPRHGELILAFDPAAFAAGRPGDPFARAEGLLDAIVGQGARLPSQRRFAARAASEARGILVPQAEIRRLERLARGGAAAPPTL